MKNEKRISLPPYEVKRVISSLSQVQGWGITQLNVPATWTITEGENIYGMVIDTGYTEHNDLEDALIKEKCKSFLEEEKDINDHNGHSSHCIGIIAARNNNMGIIGVAPKCNIITVKVLGADGTGSFDAIKDALRYAKKIKPHFISMSLGAPEDDPELHRLVRDLYEMNIPIIAAAGNDGKRNSVNYPGRYPEVICVSAYDKNGNPARFNSTGPEVGFSAPGVDIYSTWLDQKYATLSGTSMATPFMAGLVALLISKHIKQELETGQNDCKSVDQIRYHLLKYADKKGVTGHDENWGYGVINPINLINEVDIITSLQPPTISTPPIKLSFFNKIKNKIREIFKFHTK